MEIDRKTIKALSADTRIEILKMLSERRRMPAEISRGTGLAPSTVVEHLQKLVQAGLVERKETNHKWIYYEITEKGKNLIMPRIPIPITLILSLGVILVFVGFANIYFTQNFMAMQGAAERSAEITAEAPQKTITPIPIVNLIFVIPMIAGLVLIIFSVTKIIKFKKLQNKAIRLKF